MIKGDCLEVMDQLIKENVVVDLILVDPPYGTIKGLGKSTHYKEKKDRGLADCDWDEVIDINQMFDKCIKILKPKGRLVVFSQEPFTSKLRTGKYRNVKFNQSLIWVKNNAGNCLNAKKARLNYFEDISLFTHQTQVKAFKHIKPLYNLNGKSSLSNVLKYSKESKGVHPTQKPVDLLKDLILSYSNKDETVLDFTMGSGSTGVAAIKVDRKFIGIERDDKYFEIACKRVDLAIREIKNREV